MKSAAVSWLCLLSLAGCAAAPEPPRDCAPIGVMAKKLMAGRGLAYLADAIDSGDNVRMWYVRRTRDERYGEWVEIHVAHDLTACIVREGTSWHFAVGE